MTVFRSPSYTPPMKTAPILLAGLALALASCAAVPATPPADSAPGESGAVLTAGAAAPATPKLSAGDEAAIRAAVALRARAVAEGDKALYLSLLAPGDPAFLLEQSRWFDYRLSAVLSEFSLEVESLEASGPEECAVALRQRYLYGPNGEARDCRFVQLYRKVGETWLDADIAFRTLQSGHMEVRYDEGVDELRAARILADAEKAWTTVRDSYGEAPARRTVVKLFSTQELLRQNTKITIGRLFNGWGEPGESIKLFVRPDPSRSYVPVLAHELVHVVTLETSKNLCSWFAEGLANRFGNFAVLGGTYLDSGYHKPSEYDRSVQWLGSVDPEAVDDEYEWGIYGGMSGAVVGFMAERYGADSPRAVVRALASYPRVEEGYVYAEHDALFRGYLDGAMKTALGVGLEEFDLAWREWIRSRAK